MSNSNLIEKEYYGKIMCVGYNVLAIYLEKYSKTIFVHKFPPVVDAETFPDFSVKSDPEIFSSDTKLKIETLIKFWSSTDLYQANGDWKGGEWGSNNLPTTDKTWCTGSFNGTKVKVQYIKNGIIPYKTRLSKPFFESDEIYTGSEKTSWSCNITLIPNNKNCKDNQEKCKDEEKCKNEEKTYSCYTCDKPMGQKTIDVLFAYKNLKGNRFGKTLRRGKSHPNVDMPELQMPGAGEHREPGNNICFKSEVLRAVREEIGIDDDTLTNCYLLSIGTYDSDKRDPRYWKFSAEQDGKIIEFGMERKSSTDVYVLYFDSETDTEPKESNPIDMIEVGSKRWVNLDNPMFSNKEIWMILEHSLYFSEAIKILDEFDNLPVEQKILKKIVLN